MLKHHGFALLVLFFLAGCQSGNVSRLYQDGLPGTANWAVLPFVNHTESDNVTVQVERMLTVMLPGKGVEEPLLYPEFAVTTANSALTDAYKVQNGKQWAMKNNISFALAGEVNEWGVDERGKPKVALSLKVTDVRSGETLWNISGEGEGMEGDDLIAISRRLISDLLQSLPVKRRL